MRKITTAEVRQGLKSLLAEVGGDFRYEPHPQAMGNTGRTWDRCFYVNPETGAPDCGVGKVLGKLGVPVDVLRQMDDQDASDIYSAAVETVLAEAGFAIDEPGLLTLREFQKSQDMESSYGHAIPQALGFSAEEHE